MYNFNRPPPAHSPQFSVNQMGHGPEFSPRLSTPMGLYQRPPPPGTLPDPTFPSPHGDPHAFVSPRFPPVRSYPSPFAAPNRSPFPWSPTRGSFSPRFNSPNSYRESSRDSGSFARNYHSSPQSQLSYVTGSESTTSSWTSFQSARSNWTPTRGRGGAYSTESRWKRGDPIERSLSDPWADLTPITTPESGCLVANPLVQRHTVLFAPREQRRRKADQANLDDPDDHDGDLPEAKRSSSGL